MSIDRNNIKSEYDYIKAYSDCEGYISFGNAHFKNASVPPLSFKIDGVPANAFKWEKKIGTIATYTDFPTDGPVKRDVRHDVYTCKEAGIEVDVELTEYPELPVIEYLPRIKNISEKSSPMISDVTALDNEFFDGAKDVYVHHNNGGHNDSNEYEYFCDKLSAGTEKSSLSVGNVEGFPTDFALPCFNLEDRAGKRGVIAVISWAANWKADFRIDERSFKVSAGQRHTNFSLLPGEQRRTPLTVLLFYRGMWENGMNLWRMFYYKHNVLRDHGKRMTTNTLYCVSTGENGMLNTEEENLAFVKLIADLGMSDIIDFINQDAGWTYVGDRPDWNFLGNWRPDERRYPSGLRPVADAAHENGMLYSLWFEPERIMKNTELYHELGKNAIGTERDENGELRICDNEKIGDGGVFWANFCDPETVDRLIDMVDGIIKEQHVDQYRQDNGFWNIADFWCALDRRDSEQLGIPREGLSEESFVVGFHRYWKTLMDRNPGLLIDSCCAGGRRNDLETVRMSFIHTRSDCYADKDNSQTQTYGMAMWFMLMGTAMLDCTDSYDMRSRLCSSYGILLPSPENKEIFYKSFNNWKNYMTMFFSVYYPLTPCKYDHDGIVSMQFEDIDSGRGMIPIYLRSGGSTTVYPKGLCADCDYLLWSEDAPDEKRRISGSELAEKGITVSCNERYAFMYLYERQ